MSAMTEEATQATTARGCGGAVRPEPVMTGAAGTVGLPSAGFAGGPRYFPGEASRASLLVGLRPASPVGRGIFPGGEPG